MAQIGQLFSAEQNNMQVETPEVRLEARIVNLEQQVANQAVKIHDLHQHLGVKRFDEMTALKSQAAQQQAQHPYLGAGQPANLPNEQNLYAPLRSDTKPLIDLAAFARRLLNPDDLAHAVTHEVRNAARRALGMPEVREYDL
jgi:hypothetical protein